MEQKPRRILIVDDEHLIADTFVIILKQHGFSAEAAYSGTEAESLAQREPFDAALIDVVMPGIDGFDTARRLQALQPSCQIILSTGHGAMINCSDEFEILAKPIHPEDLLQLLRRLAY